MKVMLIPYIKDDPWVLEAHESEAELGRQQLKE